MKNLKFKQGDKVIYRAGVGGFRFGGKTHIEEIDAEIIFANNRHGWTKNYWPYIIRTKKFDCFAMERDLKERA